MSNLNKVFLMGRLTRDPELRYTPQGMAVSDLGVAVNREFTAQSGERRKDTLFIDVTVWKKQAEVCCQYLRKGSPIFIEGRLALDSWQGQDGQKRTKIRVVAENFQFIGGPRGETVSGGEAAEGGEEPAPGETPEYGSNFRRSRAAPPAATAGASPPGEEAYDGPKEDDIPF